MTIDVHKLQRSVGASVDGNAGRGTFTHLFRKMGASQARAEELGLSANVHFRSYGIMANEKRLSHFLAQLSHESGGFRHMEEIWGPTAAQRGYEGRADLGNINSGDGYLYRGRGPIQLTGRANYRTFGRRIGIDLERHPEIAALPSIGLHTALEYWDQRNLNELADANDLLGITRKINGGTNGIDDRRRRLFQIQGWLL